MIKALSKAGKENAGSPFKAVLPRKSGQNGNARQDHLADDAAAHPLARPSPFKNYLHSVTGAFAEGHYTEF